MKPSFCHQNFMIFIMVAFSLHYEAFFAESLQAGWITTKYGTSNAKYLSIKGSEFLMSNSSPKIILHEDHMGTEVGKHCSKISREAGECTILPPHKPDPAWNWQHWRKQAAFAEKFCYGRCHSSGRP